MKIEDIKDILNKEGVKINKRWGTAGYRNKISVGGTGIYYEGIYKGYRFNIAQVFKRSSEKGVIIKIFYPFCLNLGLYCVWNTSFLGCIPESRPVFSRQICIPVEGLRCYAIKKEIAERIFSCPLITNGIENLLKNLKDNNEKLIDTLTYDLNCLVIDDDGISFFIKRDFSINVICLFDILCGIIKAVEDYTRCFPRTFFEKPFSYKIFNAIVIFLIVLTVMITIYVISMNME